MKGKHLQITLFYCENSIQKNELEHLDEIKDIHINCISLPCSGKVSLLYLLKGIETGSDGVLLAGCKPGNCHYLQGNFRAQKRIGSVDDLLGEIGLGKGCVRFITLEENNKAEMLHSAIQHMAEALRMEMQEIKG
jgi:coenzyme F420-reducing hydrogenase delta subunit